LTWEQEVFLQTEKTNIFFIFFIFLPFKETAARHAVQIPHLVPVFRGRPVLHQHPVTPQLPHVARGK